MWFKQYDMDFKIKQQYPKVKFEPESKRQRKDDDEQNKQKCQEHEKKEEQNKLIFKYF